MPLRPEPARIRSTQLVACASDDVSVAARSRLMVAWARERGTGRLTYIGELPRERTGLSCNCECYGCGQPLEAVNAGVAPGKRAQHFRHEAHSETHNCGVLVARAALLNRLGDVGTLKLPPRHFVGLSKRVYLGPRSHSVREVRVASLATVHKSLAVLVLADGRQIAIRLRGTVTTQDDGSLLPTIVIEAPPGELANCTADELRACIHVLVEKGDWSGPSIDAMDGEVAQEEVGYGMAEAIEALDAVPEEAISHIGRSPAYETLLHWTAKYLIASMAELYVPIISVPWEAAYEIAEIHEDSCEIDRHWRRLESARVEAALGSTRPDVLVESCRRDGSDPYKIAVEVTVANPIDGDRWSRIRAEGVACLEFDLSCLPRDFTRTRLADLLVTDYWRKRWVYHPSTQRLLENLQGMVAQAPDEDIAPALERAYIKVRTYEIRIRMGTGDRSAYDDGNQVLAAACELLELRGYRSIAWDIAQPQLRTVLDRLFAMKRGETVGSAPGRAVDIFKQLEKDKAMDGARQFHVYYLMAFKAYERFVGEEDQGRFDQWANSVRQGYRRFGDRYFPSRRYDKLFGLIFPEMKQLLEYRPRPKEGGPSAR